MQVLAVAAFSGGGFSSATVQYIMTGPASETGADEIMSGLVAQPAASDVGGKAGGNHAPAEAAS